MEFSTFDNYNGACDNCKSGCADVYGANWWENCGYQSINAKYGDYSENTRNFMSWSDEATLNTIKLMFRPAV